MAVVIFHIWPSSYFRGGFVGVDIFFVISGYLITGIISKQIENKDFSIFDFYEKRIKRIFPGLLLTLLAAYIIGYIFLLPDELRQLGKHIAGGATFSSNLIYWNESGYFDADSNRKILLHLWSLGVEEQFYLVWPIFLLIAFRLNLRFKAPIIVFGISSFAWNIHQSSSNQISDFYSPLTRLWELAVGGAISQSWFHAESRGKWINIFSIIASTFLVLAIFRTLEYYKYPGWWALIPTLSTAVLIVGKNSWVNRKILSWRPLVFIGLISFPLYLWHWPVLTFLRIYWGGEPSQIAKTFAFALSLGLAWITYRFVERPVRQSSSKRNFALSPLTASLISVLAITGGVGFDCYKRNGYEERYPEIARQTREDSFSAVFNDLRNTTFDCAPRSLQQISYRYQDSNIVRCRQTKKEDIAQTIALIGDSHAEHLFYGLTKKIAEQENLVYFTFSCLPLRGLVRLGKEDCNRMELALDYIVTNPSISQVILSSYWADRSSENDFRLKDEIDNDDLDQVFTKSLDQTLRLLEEAHKRVIFAYDVPDLDFEPVDCLRRHSRIRRECKTTRAKGTESAVRYKALVEKVLKTHPNVVKWDPTAEICPSETCPIFENGHMIYLDKHHLSAYGSQKVAQTLAGLLD